MHLPLLFLLLPSHPVLSRSFHSFPPDTYAFPKYKVAFLSNLPVLNETAQKWLKEGLQGGELEFLDQPWDMSPMQPPLLFKEIGSGDSEPATPPPKPSYSLEHMKLGPRDSYLCFIPAPLDLPPPPPEVETDDDVATVNSWSLLQPLTGNCLYHRERWFTYSYCHNQEIRQFKELSNGNSHIPEEDPTWESYTLGKAPATPAPGADFTVAQRNAIATNLKLARGAGSRYLVQRWGDGTICDMTGKPREVEVQFHCSMVMSDSILFVKESKTCSYVLVINTPRLCGEPGFRSQQDVNEQAHIRCREIINSPRQPQEIYSVSEADHPQKIAQPKPVLPSPKRGTVDKLRGGGGAKGNELIRKALQAIKGQQMEEIIVQGVSEDGAFIIEVLDDEQLGGGGVEEGTIQGDMEKIANVLRKAGLDVQPQTRQQSSRSEDQGQNNDDTADQQKKKDSLPRPRGDEHDGHGVHDEL
ncbi:hypothetical protein E1B28_008701 [Marasmius oreades]|uniref:Protein OS-9 homolog n=1 Tax=Marasmius oreades TaxID=181124 RepID=A0A9P7RZ30_9AGAR|nr:uncharacterized protein E1B28_008701 [Marasmius oreades]KAG7092340.1 hypothetical protein E1B28_008701 [Marasmius oreades]